VKEEPVFFEVLQNESDIEILERDVGAAAEMKAAAVWAQTLSEIGLIGRA
jgi:hypothetical protein